MKKILIALILSCMSYIYAESTHNKTRYFSNTLQAKLAYYQGFHQRSYDLLSPIIVNLSDKGLWRDYLHSALVLEKYESALDAIAHSGVNFPLDLRSYFYILSILGERNYSVFNQDRQILWEESFEHIPVDKRSIFLNEFYHSQLMDFACSRSFMMSMLVMMGYEEQAQGLLFHPISTLDNQYLQDIPRLFPPEVLSLYLEQLAQENNLDATVDYKPLIMSGQRDFQYSSQAQAIIGRSFNSVAHYHLLLEQQAWDVLSIVALSKSQMEREKIEILENIYLSNYDEAYSALHKNQKSLSDDEYRFIYLLMAQHSGLDGQFEKQLGPLAHSSPEYEKSLKAFRFKMLADLNPDRALYQINKYNLFDNWEEQAYWQAKIHANQSRYDKALSTLNDLLRLKPDDLNIRYLLAQVLIEHYHQYTLAEKVLGLGSEVTAHSKSLYALIAMGRGEHQKSLELVHSTMDDEVSLSVALRCFQILTHYDQHESLNYYKAKFVENYPEPWREKVSEKVSAQGY